MLRCPHCERPVDLRALRHQGMFASHRICPTCGESFEVDPHTKRRQAAFMVLALISLVLTILMYVEFRQWAPFAIPSYVVLGVFVYFANKKVYLVKHESALGKPRES